MLKKIMIGLLIGLPTLAVAGAVTFAYFFGFIFPQIDETPPADFPTELSDNAVLIFDKTNGFVHKDTLPVARKMLNDIAAANGWDIYHTSNGAVMNPDMLAKFKLVVWNNTSGTTLSEEQGEAFRTWLANGGAFVGLHAAGGDFYYSWKWYVNELIGAQFEGHTMNPQFQDATVINENDASGLTSHIPARWDVPYEEWYGFDKSVRGKSNVLLSLDESSYDPNDAGMDGGDHPIAWWHMIGEGRVVYSAIGHQPDTYLIPEYHRFVEKAMIWAGRF